MTIEVPAKLAEAQLRYNGAAGREFIAGLPAHAARYLTEWELRRDGPPLHGLASLVLPVVRADGTPAALKLQLLDEETESEPAGLRAWAGDGAVRLLDADPATGVMLLERLHPHHSLSSVTDDVQALTLLTGLLARLVAHPAPHGIRRLHDIARTMLAQTPEAAHLLPDDERGLILACAAAVADLVDEPGDRLLHWDLHYDNVLAADREPWLAIDPKPLAGDPGFDLMPALDNRWDALVASGNVGRAVRYRFDLMTEMLGLDRRRAAGWTLGRALQNTLWDLEDGEPGMSEQQRVVAEAVLPTWKGR
ncbi:aminoglycoside phosphotransferase family protein [Nocardia sp. BMG51109]|uniref:aminoglycoside phosphotransferase family protein n=1 Tax=Nocardia sp. BMG51109 TaxID=1056816 RepID=UPI0004BBBE3F|nr:aminoglycoside phosphotransferase family protein [Nocardia sp. BMG51109]